MSINHNDYVARITTATPLGLTLITYELAINNIEKGIENYELDLHLAKKCLKKASQCINELMDSLDMQYSISTSLASLYIYCNKLVIDAMFKNNISSLEEVKKILTELHSGFSQIEDTTTEAVMENADAIYSGLTYKNGKLDEYVDTSKSKGFKA